MYTPPLSWLVKISSLIIKATCKKHFYSEKSSHCLDVFVSVDCFVKTNENPILQTRKHFHNMNVLFSICHSKILHVIQFQQRFGKAKMTLFLVVRTHAFKYFELINFTHGIHWNYWRANYGGQEKNSHWEKFNTKQIPSKSHTKTCLYFPPKNISLMPNVLPVPYRNWQIGLAVQVSAPCDHISITSELHPISTYRPAILELSAIIWTDWYVK